MKVKILGIIAIFGGLLVVALLAGALFFGLTSQASAQEYTSGLGGLTTRLFHHGRGGFGGGEMMQGEPGDGDSYLAEALGISLEELQAAQAQAQEAALQQAVEQGLLTEAQADMLRERLGTGRFGFGSGMFGFGMHGKGAVSTIDFQAQLADELGISVTELETAQQAARTAAIQAAVESGDLTQEQADMMLARQALSAYLDPQALMAEALGITIDQLQTYQAEGLRMSEILADLGKSTDEFQAAHQAAHAAAIAQAVADGVISQAQADALESAVPFGPGGLGGCDGMRGGRGGRGGGMHGFPGRGAPDKYTPGATSSGDA